MATKKKYVLLDQFSDVIDHIEGDEAEARKQAETAVEGGESWVRVYELIGTAREKRIATTEWETEK